MREMGNTFVVFIVLTLILCVLPSSPANLGAQHVQDLQLAKTGQGSLSLGTDLSVKIVGQENLPVYPGFPLRNSVKVFIANGGVKDAQNFDVDIIFADNRFLTGKNQLLSRLRVPLLKGHASGELKFEKGFNIPENAPFRKSYLVALVDPGNTVKETDENNNAAALAVLVQMRITSVGQYPESPETELELNGLGFGSTPGSKQVCLDSYPHQECFAWTPTKIVIHAADVPCRRNYTVTIMQDSVPISNAVVMFLKCVIDHSEPKQGQPGTIVHIYGHGFGSAQGGKTLKLGTTLTSTIQSWAEHDIVCQIPAGMAPGSYIFSVWENGIDVSLCYSIEAFTIL